MSTTEDAKIRAARKLAAALTEYAATLERIQSPGEPDLFGDIGLSNEFLATELPDQVLSTSELARITAQITKAADSRDMATVNQIVAVIGQVLGPVKAILGLG